MFHIHRKFSYILLQLPYSHFVHRLHQSSKPEQTIVTFGVQYCFNFYSLPLLFHPLTSKQPSISPSSPPSAFDVPSSFLFYPLQVLYKCPFILHFQHFITVILNVSYFLAVGTSWLSLFFTVLGLVSFLHTKPPLFF